jgi:hypothetical protein
LCTLFGAQRHVHTFPRVLDPQELMLLGEGAWGQVRWREWARPFLA